MLKIGRNSAPCREINSDKKTIILVNLNADPQELENLIY